MRTLSEIAGDGYRGMETATREDGTAYVRIREDDGAPAWLRDGIADMHGTDMLPDDWRYALIRDALGALEDAGHEDRIDAEHSDTTSEIADSAIDTYNHDRIAWLGSHGARVGYVDAAVSDGLVSADADTLDRIAGGQYVEASEIAARVLDVVADVHEAQDDDDDDDDPPVPYVPGAVALVLRHPDADPYPLEDAGDLEAAVHAEAATIAAEAGSDLLEDPGETARAALRRRVILEAAAALTRPGATYRDPVGITWELRGEDA